jgi:ArsR family transcriptional regulator, arsenate/arsenite/antimonite-responsive transcriptional repressor
MLTMRRQRQFDIQQFFQALSDNTRLRLLNLMGDREVCVCYFVEILRVPQPKISRHLAYLRNAGIVSARREGKWMHYRIVMPPHSGATQILRQTLRWMKEDRAMQGDRERLARACCVPAKYALRGAPLPAAAEPCCDVS